MACKSKNEIHLFSTYLKRIKVTLYNAFKIILYVKQCFTVWNFPLVEAFSLFRTWDFWDIQVLYTQPGLLPGKVCWEPGRAVLERTVCYLG